MGQATSRLGETPPHRCRDLCGKWGSTPAQVGEIFSQTSHKSQNKLQHRKSSQYSQLKAPFPRLCALDRPSRLFRTTSSGGRAELTPLVIRLSLGNVVLGLAVFSDSLTLSPPAVHSASMIDLILHNQVNMKTGVLRSTLRTGNKSGYRAGGRYTNSNK